jgi:hypothetical protein
MFLIKHHQPYHHLVHQQHQLFLKQLNHSIINALMGHFLILFLVIARNVIRYLIVNNVQLMDVLVVHQVNKKIVKENALYLINSDYIQIDFEIDLKYFT